MEYPLAQDEIRNSESKYPRQYLSIKEDALEKVLERAQPTIFKKQDFPTLRRKAQAH
jgi:hypothetical protein